MRILSPEEGTGPLELSTFLWTPGLSLPDMSRALGSTDLLRVLPKGGIWAQWVRASPVPSGPAGEWGLSDGAAEVVLAQLHGLQRLSSWSLPASPRALGPQGSRTFLYSGLVRPSEVRRRGLGRCGLEQEEGKAACLHRNPLCPDPREAGGCLQPSRPPPWWVLS